MKRSWFGVPALLLLVWGDLEAQVGLAARLESGSPLSLGVPILLRRGGFLLEPVVVFDRFSGRIEEDSVSGAAGSSVDQESHSTTLRFGVGAYLRSRGPVRVFGGPRIGWGRESFDLEARLAAQPGIMIREQGVLSGVWYGALLGAEAQVGERFLLGAELQWYAEALEGDIDESSNFGGPAQSGTSRRSEHTAFTQLAVVLRWFPWRPPR